AERRRDPALLALAARVRYTVDPDSPFPRTFPGRVRVHLLDGRVVEAQEPENRGGPGRPLAESELVEKFRDNAGRALPGAQVLALEKAALDLERLDDVGALMALCRRG
ncbi:MAG TPA: hypothetical protein VFF62_00870, partial [Candidatus Nitrosocosmicus sp.]|nr:hypothetical protein [Candidatus Nitrosocosmicus sp.]